MSSFGFEKPDKPIDGRAIGAMLRQTPAVNPSAGQSVIRNTGQAVLRSDASAIPAAIDGFNAADSDADTRRRRLGESLRADPSTPTHPESLREAARDFADQVSSRDIGSRLPKDTERHRRDLSRLGMADAEIDILSRRRII